MILKIQQIKTQNSKKNYKTTINTVSGLLVQIGFLSFFVARDVWQLFNVDQFPEQFVSETPHSTSVVVQFFVQH